MRAVRRDVLAALDLRTVGMEFASEMVIRAAKREPRRPRVPDRAPPARRRVEALAVPRRLAAPAAHPRLQPELPVHLPGAAALLAGVADRATRARGHPDLRPRTGRSTPDRRRRCSFSWACRRSGSDCAPAPTASTSSASRTRSSIACGRGFRLEHGWWPGGSASWSGSCSAASSSRTWISVGGFGDLSDEYLAVVSATAIVVAGSRSSSRRSSSPSSGCGGRRISAERPPRGGRLAAGVGLKVACRETVSPALPRSSWLRLGNGSPTPVTT